MLDKLKKHIKGIADTTVDVTKSLSEDVSNLSLSNLTKLNLKTVKKFKKRKLVSWEDVANFPLDNPSSPKKFSDNELSRRNKHLLYLVLPDSF